MTEIIFHILYEYVWHVWYVRVSSSLTLSLSLSLSLMGHYILYIMGAKGVQGVQVLIQNLFENAKSEIISYKRF